MCPRAWAIPLFGCDRFENVGRFGWIRMVTCEKTACASSRSRFGFDSNQKILRLEPDIASTRTIRCFYSNH